MHAVSNLYTPKELVKALMRTGKKITLKEVSLETFESQKYRSEQEPMVWDIGKLTLNGGFVRDLALSKRGNPNPTDIHRYIATNPSMRSFLGVKEIFVEKKRRQNKITSNQPLNIKVDLAPASPRRANWVKSRREIGAAEGHS